MPSSQDHEAALFALAVRKPVSERESFLQAVCGSDKPLRQRLDALLSAHEQPETLLATQAEAARPTIKLDLADAPDESVGQTLGRYKLLEQIGEGGCGMVYVAEQKEPVRRKVALKVIKLGMDTKQVVARFEAERQALAMMDHPNIAKVLDAGTTDVGRPFFVMELVRGIRITDYCDQANLSTKERLDLFIKVCHAIQHAHQKGIIHRDIKPSNILVTLHDGVPVPKVIDFGIAKATQGELTDKTIHTQFQQFIGTPAYMSPEQAELSGLDIDTRSDIYSLGVLLYELLAGSTPFDAKDLMASGIDAMRKTIREKEPQRPSTRFATLGADQLTTTAKRRSADTSKLLHQLKGDLDWIVMKCLEKDRQRRYETANGLAADLKRHLNNEPVVARPPSTIYRFQKAFRRNKLVFAAAAAVVAALLFGVIASTWQATVAIRAEAGRAEEARKAQSERDNAKAAEAQAQTDRKLAVTAQQHSRRLLYAADMNLAQQSLKLNNLGRARRLLDRHRPQPGEEDLRGWEWRYLWQITRSSALVTLTTRPTTRGFDVSFSPNATRLAVGWMDGQVDLWDVPARRLLKVLTQGADGPAAHVAFSPVRNLLAATSTNGVTLYDLDSGRESVLLRASKPDWSGVRELSFSPDGSRLVIYAMAREAGNSIAEVCVVEVSSQQIASRHKSKSQFVDYLGYPFFGAARLSTDHRRLYLPRFDPDNVRYGIRCVDPSSGNEIWQTEMLQDNGLSALALSPDGKVLVSGSGFGDSIIRVWDAMSGRLLRQLDSHTSWVSKLVFSLDGRQLLSSATDQTVRVWETSTWNQVNVLRGHSDEIHGLALSEAAELIASASKDGDLMLWRADGKTAAEGYSRLPVESRTSVWPLDHSRVAMVSSQGLQLSDLKSDAPPISLIGPSTNILGPFGTNIVAEWNGTNQVLLREMRGTDFLPLGAITVESGLRPMSMDYNPKHQLLAWTDSSSSNSVHVASLAEPGRRRELKSNVAVTNVVRFSDDGDHLLALTGSGDAWHVWEVGSGRIVVSAQESLRHWVWAAGGRILVAGISTPGGYEIAFYDLDHPGRTAQRVPGRDALWSLARSPDGSLVASADVRGLVRLFDPARGEPLATLHGHLNGSLGLAFSPDGRRLISTSSGRETVKLWDVGMRQELLTLVGTSTAVVRARWTADGDVILVGAPWQAWRAPTWAEIAAAEAKEKAESKQP